MGKHNHWVPSFKWQLVNALIRIWPDDRSKFNRQSKKQLYAIWFGRWSKSCSGCRGYKPFESAQLTFGW